MSTDRDQEVRDRLRHLRSHRWAYVLVQTNAFDGDAAALQMPGELKRDVAELARQLDELRRHL